MDDLNISELLNNEIEKAHRLLNPLKESDSSQKLSDLTSQISNEVILKIEREIFVNAGNLSNCVPILSGLLNLVTSSEFLLDSFWTNQVFIKIRDKLDAMMHDNLGDEVRLENIFWLQNTIEVTAIKYFRH